MRLRSHDDIVTVKPITDDVWPEICAYDAAAFGSERSRLLTCLRGRMPAADWLRYAVTGSLASCSAARAVSRLNSARLLPRTPQRRARLLARAIAAITGPIFIDLADSKAATRAFIEAQGFSLHTPAHPDGLRQGERLR